MQTQDRRAHVAGDEEVTAAPPRRRRTAPGVAVAVAVVVLLATGVLVWGRVAPTEMIAMALTGGWFLAVLGAAAIVARRRRHLAVPLAIGYGLSAVAAFVLLGLPQLRDTTVDEQVATVDSVPAAQADEPASGGDAAADPAADAPDDSADPPDEPDGADAADADAQEDQPDADAPAGNTAAVTGTFVDLVHPGAGTATVVELADGGRVLTLTGFETDPGPDLRVHSPPRIQRTAARSASSSISAPSRATSAISSTRSPTTSTSRRCRPRSCGAARSPSASPPPP